MGFFDTIKSIKNVITGGAADVCIEITPVTFGEPFDVTIKAQLDSADLKIDRVYLEIEGREEIEVPDVDVIYYDNNEQERRTEIVRAQCLTTSLEIIVDEAQTLNAEQGYEWNVRVELPEEALPLYAGEYCRHYYVARASLDCFGNDPDSGWIELEFN